MVELGISNKDVYTDAVMISSELQTYNPRVTRLFCW